MRILIATWHYRPHVGGAERKAELFARTLAAQGHEITVVTGRRSLSLPAQEVRDGVRVCRLWPGRHLSTAVRMALWVWCRRKKIDLIHGFIVNGPMVAVGAVAARFGIPMTVAPASMGFHSDLDTLQGRLGGRQLAARSLSLPWKIAASTEDMAQELRRRGFAPEQVFHRPTGVHVPPIEMLTPAAERDRTVVVVGRLAAVKGPDVALEAWREVHRKRPEWRLVFVGDGEMRAELERTCEVTGIADSVTFVGAAESPWELPEAAKAAVYLQPSRMEGLSNALLEAMAHGLPAIATAVGGTPSLEGSGIVLVPPEEPESLAEAIYGMIENPEEREARGSSAREYIEANHNVEKLVWY